MLTSREICSEVMGCSHIKVFIAGQNNNGFLTSQARIVQVCQQTQSLYINDKNPNEWKPLD